MAENKLTFGDQAFIAKALGISRVTVEFIINGKRGKRSTLNQQKIRMAVAYRESQNQRFEQYCDLLRQATHLPASQS